LTMQCYHAGWSLHCPCVPHTVRTSKQLHSRCLARPPGWLSNVVCLPLQISIKAECQTGSLQLLQLLCLYSGCRGLSHTSAEPDHGWLQKTVANAFELIYGWSVAGAVFYNVIITARRRRSVNRLLVTDMPQSDQLTWRTSKHLTRRLCVITVGTLGGRDVDNFCLWIIRNCCLNYWKRKIIPFQPKNHVWIIREVVLLERKR